MPTGTSNPVQRLCIQFPDMDVAIAQPGNSDSGITGKGNGGDNCAGVNHLIINHTAAQIPESQHTVIGGEQQDFCIVAKGHGIDLNDIAHSSGGENRTCSSFPECDAVFSKAGRCDSPICREDNLISRVTNAIRGEAYTGDFSIFDHVPDDVITPPDNQQRTCPIRHDLSIIQTHSRRKNTGFGIALQVIQCKGVFDGSLRGISSEYPA